MINKKRYTDQIELRKTIDGVQALIVVAKDGWNYGTLDADQIVERPRPFPSWQVNSKGKQVRLSMNGPLRMTKEEFSDLVIAVNNAWDDLNA